MNDSDPMKDEKAFDCVAMKAEIQHHLVCEVAELGEEEARKRRAVRLALDPILSGFLRKKAGPEGATEGAPVT